MESWNESAFLWLNASAHPLPMLLLLARGLAEYLFWLLPAGLVWGWLRGDDETRTALLAAAIAGLVGMGINQLIGLVYVHPRPFMLQLGHTFLAHAPDSSFPSDHLTLIWATAFSLWLAPATRRMGVMCALLGLPVAWARIYLGVHFPLDMLAAAGIGALAAYWAMFRACWLISPLLRAALALYRRAFAPLIVRGWVKA
jgi:undecaprenyl-diphosphatase